MAILESDKEPQLPRFEQMLATNQIAPLQSTGIEVLQVNVGKTCNQTCRHCHVDAGPDRRESMTRETAEAVISVLDRGNIKTLDITGGAPEMNPNFRYLASEAHRLGRKVIDRCNLTILVANGFTYLPEFLAEHEVEVIASLPCYLEDNCDAQRGSGVFRQSIDALHRLNELGYGKPDSPLNLTLVYNPIGPVLPPDQAKLEEDYRRELKARYDVEFTQLFTITNLPISRYLSDLLEQGDYEPYMQKLIEAFNPEATQGVMCRTMLSVDWLGNLFDCDFNQMLDLPVTVGSKRTIFDIDLEELSTRTIQTGRHCFGCTAGAGSSCGGKLV